MRRRSIHYACLCLLLACASAHGLIEIGRGNQPVTDKDWPAGALDVANLKTRVGWWEGPPFGGGEWCFPYRGDTAAFNEALAAFARIKWPQLLLVVHEGRGEGQFLKDSADDKADASVDWELTLWTPENFHHLFNNPTSAFASDQPEFRGELPPPKLDVYPAPGRIDWSHVTVPANVTVRDERATANGFSAEDGSVVRGDVYDMLRSKPIAGAAVTVDWRPPQNRGTGEFKTAAAGTTDSDGHFQVTHVPPGSYRIVVRRSGYAPRMLGWATFKEHTLKTFTTQLSPAVDAVLTVSQSSGEPLTGVQVRCDSAIALDGRGDALPEKPTGVSNLAGQVKLAGLPRGHAQFAASAKGFFQLDMLALREVPGTSLQIVMTGTGALHGHVKLARGQSAAGVNVSVRPEGELIGKWSGSMQVNADGSFQFDDVPPGRYFVSTDPMFSFTGVDANAVAVTVEPGKTAEVEVSIPTPAKRRR
jgi:hypothetical protein